MDQKTFLDIINQAIEREIEAYRFYNDVAQKTQIAFLKELFYLFQLGTYVCFNSRKKTTFIFQTTNLATTINWPGNKRTRLLLT